MLQAPCLWSHVPTPGTMPLGSRANVRCRYYAYRRRHACPRRNDFEATVPAQGAQPLGPRANVSRRHYARRVHYVCRRHHACPRRHAFGANVPAPGAMPLGPRANVCRRYYACRRHYDFPVTSFPGAERALEAQSKTPPEGPAAPPEQWCKHPSKAMAIATVDEQEDGLEQRVDEQANRR